MLRRFREGRALKRILKDNKGKISLQRGPLGHYWFDTIDGVAFEDLVLPNEFTYKQHLYSDNGGGQFLIINDEEEQLGRINTYSGRRTR